MAVLIRDPSDQVARSKVGARTGSMIMRPRSSAHPTGPARLPWDTDGGAIAPFLNSDAHRTLRINNVDTNKPAFNPPDPGQQQVWDFGVGRPQPTVGGMRAG